MWEAYTNTKPSFAVRIENTKPSFAFRRKHEAAFCSCGSKTAIYFVDLHHAFETGSRLMWKAYTNTKPSFAVRIENTKPSFAFRRKHEAAFCSCGSKTAIYFVDLHHAFETGSRLMWKAYTNTKPSFAVRIENTKPSFAFRRKHEFAQAFETGSRLEWAAYTNTKPSFAVRRKHEAVHFVENTKPPFAAVLPCKIIQLKFHTNSVSVACQHTRLPKTNNSYMLPYH